MVEFAITFLQENSGEFNISFSQEGAGEFGVTFGEYIEKPIPSNYGLITWDGNVLTVS